MLDLTKFEQKPKIEVIGVITSVGEVKTIPSQNGEFFVQEFGMEIFYGKVEKPYVETLAFQATSKGTRKWDKDTSAYVDAPSFIEQFKTKPLQVGAVVSIKCDVSGYVGAKKGKGYTIPKISLETLWYIKEEEKAQVVVLIETAKANRAAAGI